MQRSEIAWDKQESNHEQEEEMDVEKKHSGHIDRQKSAPRHNDQQT